jgi:hypothetical protein
VVDVAEADAAEVGVAVEAATAMEEAMAADEDRVKVKVSKADEGTFVRFLFGATANAQWIPCGH